MAERRFAFLTLDVFTDRRFGGNPLAVFPDAAGLDAGQMQALAKELNLSETSFVLPPEDRSHTARVRIFTPRAELPFAGHPNVGTAWALASRGRDRDRDGVLLFEEAAGLVEIAVERKGGAVVSCSVSAPQPLSKAPAPDAATLAACAGLSAADIGPPVTASVGASFVCAPTSLSALSRAAPDLAGFRAAAAGPAGEFALLLYARDGNAVSQRMFAPRYGIAEDPATGSAAAALGALLLDQDGGERAAFEIRQGAEVGRPSLMQVIAHRDRAGVRASVGGACVFVLRGEAEV